MMQGIIFARKFAQCLTTKRTQKNLLKQPVRAALIFYSPIFFFIASGMACL